MYLVQLPFISTLMPVTVLLTTQVCLVKSRHHGRHHVSCVDQSTQNTINNPCLGRALVVQAILDSSIASMKQKFFVLRFDTQNILNHFACTLDVGCTQSLVDAIGQISESSNHTVTILRRGSFTPEVLQTVNEFYANVTFIMKQASILSQHLVLREDETIETIVGILLNDMRSIMCQLRQIIGDVSNEVTEIRTLRTCNIIPINDVMSGTRFFMNAIQILYNLRRFSENMLQQLGWS